MSASPRDVAARLGPVGVWSAALGHVPAAEARDAVIEMERLGYGGLWIGEIPGGKEVLTHAGILLGASEHIVVATGIANIWLRDPAAMKAAAQTLAEAYPDRFVLGIGASHAAALALVGRDYAKPLTAMRTYLEAMSTSPWFGPAAEHPPAVLVGALRSKMQELSRNAADGMHSFFVSPAHTAAARELLGPGPLLVPEQAMAISADTGAARAAAQAHVRSRLALPNYVKHVQALGYTDEDLAGGGSDRLVDELVAWGSVEDVAARVRQHLDAGADHVAVQPLGPTHTDVGLDQLEQLAAALGLRSRSA